MAAPVHELHSHFSREKVERENLLMEHEFLNKTRAFRGNPNLTFCNAAAEHRPNTPPEGCVCVYTQQLEMGLLIPFQDEFLDVFKCFGMVPAQLPPNAIAYIYAFAKLLRRENIKWDLKLFRAMFVWFPNHYYKGCYNLRSRGKKPLFSGASSSYSDWRDRYFFVGNTELKYYEPVAVDPAVFEEPAIDQNLAKQVGILRGYMLNIKDFLRELKRDIKANAKWPILKLETSQEVKTMKRKKKGEILVYREPKKMAGKAAGGRFNSFGKGSYVRRVFESSSEEETSSDDVLTLSQLIEARRASPTSPAVDKGKKEVTELGRIEVSATEDRKEETPRAANCSGPLGDAAPVSPAPAKTQAKFISSELPNDIRFSIADAFSMEEYQQKIASTDNATLGAQVVSASLKNLLDQRTLVQRVEELGRDCVGQKCEITQLNEKLCKSQWELGALEGKLMLAKRENEAMKGDLRARKVMCQLLLSLFRGAKNENKQLQSRVQSLEESSPNAIVGYKKSLECRQIQLNRMKDGWEALAGGLLREQKISSDKIRGLDFIGCLQTVGESEYAEERFNVSDRTVQRLFDALEAAGEGEDAPE